MRDLGPQHFECSECGARVLVAFSEERPVITFEGSDSRRVRVVSVSNVEVHRCPASDPSR
jgi:hypothetical protein